MTTTRELIEKADLAVTDLTSSGGALTAEQASAFFRTAVNEASLAKYADIHTFDRPSKVIDKAGFLASALIMKPAVDGVAFTEDQRSSLTLAKTTLTPKEYRVHVILTKQTLEDNIERGGLVNTVRDLIAEKVADDIDNHVLNDALNSATANLTNIDGLLFQATTHVVSAASAVFSDSIALSLLKEMPKQYRKDRSKLCFLLPSDAELHYRNVLGSRATQYGDVMRAEGKQINVLGVPVVGLPQLPVSSYLGTGLLVDTKNIAIGFNRQVTFETQPDITAGLLHVVVSLRMDAKFIVEDAAVKCTNISIPA